MPSGYRVLDANGVVMAHVYGQPDDAIAVASGVLSPESRFLPRGGEAPGTVPSGSRSRTNLFPKLT
jgi:hypothetical protein